MNLTIYFSDAVLGAAKEQKSSSSNLKSKRSAEVLPGVKKESGLGVPSSTLLAAKKPKLVGQTFTPLGRPVDDRGRASPSTHIYHYDEIAKEGKKYNCATYNYVLAVNPYR